MTTNNTIHTNEKSSQKIASSNSQIVVIFEVTPTAEGKADYLKMADALKKELGNAKGFISGERYQSLSEERKLLSINVWESEQALNEWRNNMQHRMSQKAGHDSLFEKYNIMVASVIRNYSKENRIQAPQDSNDVLK